MPANRHPANITDSLRLLGALCVVWYHNPLYWNLQDYSPAVDAGKLLVLGWSMPFFYATSAKFAFAGKKPAHLICRMFMLLMLIVFYTVLYELSHWRNESSLFSRCLGNVDGCSPKVLFDTFRNVSNTPGYYLSDLVSMYMLACVAAIRPIFGWGVAATGWAAFLLGLGKMGGLFLNPLALGCLAVALLYRYLLVRHLDDVPQISLRTPGFLLLLILLPWAWGVANYFVGQNDYWSDPAIIPLFALFLLVFLLVGDVTQPTGCLPSALSRWGREYSFGIFIFHQLCFDLLGTRAVAWGQRLFQVNDSLLLYLAAGLTATASAIVLTAVIRKISPALLAS